jgi:hypothetical protein
MVDFSLGNSNPYIIGRPIYEPNLFYGREELFEFIRVNLHQKSRVILLHGQRRIGKSSSLVQIPKSLRLEKFVFVNLSLEGKSHKNVGEVLHEISEDIKDFLTSELDIHIGEDKVPLQENFIEDPGIFSDCFLRNVFDVLQKCSLVLLLDEFDVMEEPFSGSISETFFVYLRSALNEHANLFIIPVLGRRVEDLPNLLNIFHEAPNYEIGFLSRENTERVVREPSRNILNYEDGAIEAIFELTSGHPYLTQVLCFALFNKARNRNINLINLQDINECIEEAIEIGEGGLAWFHDGLYAPERVILSVIAEAQEQEQGPVTEDKILQILENNEVIVTRTLLLAKDTLLQFNFLVEHSHGSEAEPEPNFFSLSIELVRRWLLKRHPATREAKSYESNITYQLEILKKDVNIWNDWRSKHDYILFDFSGQNLQGLDLTGANLSQVNFERSNLSYSKLSKANLTKSDLRSANLASTNFLEANLAFADLSGANLEKVNFSHANLLSASLDNSLLVRANFQHASLNNSSLKLANLRSANLNASQVLSANFTGANLTGACIADWQIGSSTTLENVDCDYIFRTINEHNQFSGRLPADDKSTFAPGEFVEHFQLLGNDLIPTALRKGHVSLPLTTSPLPLEFRQIGSCCTEKTAQSLESGKMPQRSLDRVPKRWT